MKMKRLLALLMAGIMIFTVGACGNGSKDTGNETDNLDWSAGADADGGEVTLRVATWRKTDIEYYEEIARRFEEKYDWINVEFEFNQDTSSYYTNLQADLLSGTAPDVFDSHPKDTLTVYAKEGLIAPQTDFDYMKNYSKDAEIVTTMYGENYGFLFTYNYYGFLYNKKVFEKVGVSVPTTPDELVDAVKKFKAAGYGGVIFAGSTWQEATGGLSIATILASLGTEGYQALREGLDDGSITDISTVKGIPEAFDTLQAYIQNDIYYNAFEGITHEAGMSLYAQEKSPIVYTGTYIFGEKDAYFPDIDTGYFPVPTYAEGNTSYAEGGQITCINAASKNLGAAKLWVEFVATPEISEYYCTNAKMMSTIEGANVEFEEKDMIMEYTDGYAIKAIVETEHSEYWASGWKNVLNGVFYEKEGWKDLVNMYTTKLEEYDLASY